MATQRLKRTSSPAELIDKFKKAVNDCLMWNKMIHVWTYTQKKAKETSPTPYEPLPEEWQEYFDDHKKCNQALADVREIGHLLAGAMEAEGEDSLDVLKIVHCADAHGGGADYIVPLWPVVKPRLEQLAIRLRRQAQEADIRTKKSNSNTPTQFRKSLSKPKQPWVNDAYVIPTCKSSDFAKLAGVTTRQLNRWIKSGNLWRGDTATEKKFDWYLKDHAKQRELYERSQRERTAPNR